MTTPSAGEYMEKLFHLTYTWLEGIQNCVTAPVDSFLKAKHGTTIQPRDSTPEYLFLRN